MYVCIPAGGTGKSSSEAIAFAVATATAASIFKAVAAAKACCQKEPWASGGDPDCVECVPRFICSFGVNTINGAPAAPRALAILIVNYIIIAHHVERGSGHAIYVHICVYI